MAFDVSALSSWVKPGDEMIAALIAEGQTSKYIDTIPGIKSSQYVNTYASTIVMNSGVNCAFAPSSTTTIGQVLLTVDPISIQESFCIKDFDTKSLQNKLKPGSTGNDVDVVNNFMDEKRKTIGFENNKLAWQANKTSGTGNMARTNGYLYYLLHTSYSSSTVTATSAVTSSNILATVDYVVNNIPAAILTRTDLTLFMTSTNYRLYINALRDAGSTHFTGEAGSEWSTKMPSYGITVVCLPELDGNADGVDMLLSFPDNLKRGTDILNEEDRFEIWWSQDTRKVNFNCEYKVGYNVVFPQYVVIIK